MPESCKKLIGLGYEITLEAGAGIASGFPDALYRDLGVVIDADPARVVGSADLVLKVAEIPGPTALLPSTATAEQVRLAAAICARYSDTAPNRPATIVIHSPRGEQRLEATPAQPEAVEAMRI